MSPFAQHIPYAGRIRHISEIFQTELDDPLLHILGIYSRLAHGSQVAFHIRQKYRYAQVAERFGHDLQGDGLSGSGRSRDQSVTVGHLRNDAHSVLILVLCLSYPHHIIFKHIFPSSCA